MGIMRLEDETHLQLRKYAGEIQAQTGIQISDSQTIQKLLNEHYKKEA